MLLLYFSAAQHNLTAAGQCRIVDNGRGDVMCSYCAQYSRALAHNARTILHALTAKLGVDQLQLDAMFDAEWDPEYLQVGCRLELTTCSGSTTWRSRSSCSSCCRYSLSCWCTRARCGCTCTSCARNCAAPTPRASGTGRARRWPPSGTPPAGCGTATRSRDSSTSPPTGRRSSCSTTARCPPTCTSSCPS